MKKLKFYVPGGKPITTDDYHIITLKNGRKAAVHKLPNGAKAYRFVKG